MAPRGRWRSYAALLTVLKGINGAPGGYWLDFGGRVYERLVLPEEADAIEKPYGCVPLFLQQPDYEDNESYVTARWKQSIFVFVDELQRDLDTSANETILKAHDDIVRAVSLDYTLAGTVDNSRFIAGGDEVGALVPDDDSAELEIVLQLESRFCAADLGPDAA